MRKGLFLGVLLSSLMMVGTAAADRNDSDDKKASRGMQIKEQVLQKQKTSFTKAAQAERVQKQNVRNPLDRARPKGEIFGDQAGRSGKSRASQAAGRNLSATGAVNTPVEIRRALKMINPMLGAYRTSQAMEGTDSYGGQAMVPNGKGSGASKQKNLTATGAVNTPAEIRAMVRMINPMHGAYRMSAAAEGTDSYGGKSMTPGAYGMSAGGGHVHMKNERGQVNKETRGNTATAMKNAKIKEAIEGKIKAKIAEKAKIAGR